MAADSVDVDKSWSANVTRMLIQHYKENHLLWDKNLKDYGNKVKTKKALAPLLAKLEKSTSPRTLDDIKNRWHNLRSSLLRYMKKTTGEVIKWVYWDDMSFLRESINAGVSGEHVKTWTTEDTETLITFYQENESLWNHNIADYHQDSNKDLLYDTLVKMLDDKYDVQDINMKWKELIKFFKQEHAKASHKPSGSGTTDIYKPSWEFFEQLRFVIVICDDTDDTVDSLVQPPKAKSRKLSKKFERDAREEKKLELFAQAGNAMQEHEPSQEQHSLSGNSEAAAFANCVSLTLSKFSPRQFRRAKKCIGDILYQIEENADVECVSNDTSMSYADIQKHRYNPSSFSSHQQTILPVDCMSGNLQQRSFSPSDISSFQGQYHDLS